ncbi:MAG: DedA family protein [Methanomassiliicoccales archaeon]|jgi:membrane protein DedA with SNARE-associated domain|nr:DedA family protein [Methanomassiliicoccales archaeon]
MGIIESLNQIIIDFISSSGYPGIFFAMFIEGIITPIPSELIMPFAGYLASTGRFSLPLVILAGTLGATLGSTVAYGIARLVGRPIVDKYGRYIFLDQTKVDKADAWFKKYGSWGILLGHAIPGIRSIISFPAGIFKMDLKRFILFTFLGALIWNTVLSSAGYLLGEYYIEFWKALEGWDLIIIAIAVVAVAAYLLWHRRRTVPVR